MTRERFVEKLGAYAAWQDGGDPAEALGIRRFRVLTITKSEERLRSLLEATAGSSRIAGSLPIFWFTAARCVADDGGSILGRIWQTADASEIAKSILPSAG